MHGNASALNQKNNQLLPDAPTSSFQTIALRRALASSDARDMMGLHPFDTYGFGHRFPATGMPRHVRAPPRSAPTPAHNDTSAPEPRIHLEEKADQYIAHIESPVAGYQLHDVNATLDGDRDIVIRGKIVSSRGNGFHQYVTTRRAGVYSEPHQSALVGVVPTGQRVTGGQPTRHGWIALDDDESWMLDDGSLALARRHAPTRPTPFAKRVSLPADAELHRARIQQDESGGMLISVPRTRRTTPRREVPINIKRSPAPQPAPAAAAAKKPAAPATAKMPPSKAAAPSPAPAPAASKNSVSAEEYKQQHKRKAAQRRDLAAELAELHGVAYEGPVLTECNAPSSRNVQSPTESVEEWVATADGGFAPGDDGTAQAHAAKRRSSFKPVAAEQDDEDELSFWGF